jgi:ATP synthase protein I
MSDQPRPASNRAADLAEQVGASAARKLRAQRQAAAGIWFGLGTMGLIGWSVTVPTLAGAALGLWVDHHYPGGHSWTLALLVAGLSLGCLNAWRWLSQQERAIRGQQEDHDE